MGTSRGGGFSHCGARSPGCAGSVVAAHGLSCSTACGIFPDRGSNLCLLHRQVDSLPLSHQGSPHKFFFLKDVLLIGGNLEHSFFSYAWMLRTANKKLFSFYHSHIVRIIGQLWVESTSVDVFLKLFYFKT